MDAMGEYDDQYPFEYMSQFNETRKMNPASLCVFGVSVESMQCSYDERGNSVPMILLMMQKRLYAGGGLQVIQIRRTE
ncbi:hypothetical protein M8C21_028513 [Ambrosia artemisiifolia]|uniref:Uncharacterized protein n=1 Tax=Ambrosia artemisiifolia TaxID=4212 RepID=A0AAD5D7Q3_AMBAR|nr:hypothetical protein M8C21_028513 [Ambrosia artemisiifolia]